jgi:TonB family protein
VAPPPAATAAPPASAPAPLPPPNPNGLTLPAKLSGDPPRLPDRAAVADGAKARARCTITVAGAVEGCKIIEAPPGTEALVLAALATWRYRPAFLKGEPIASENVIDVAFAGPASNSSGPSAAAPPKPTPPPLRSSAAPPMPPPLPPGSPLPFDAGTMTRPRLVSGRQPDYTPEARAAAVEGTVIARCTILPTGKLRDCKLLKTLPMLEATILEALATQVYTPVIVDGRPTAVAYTLLFRFKLN